MDAVEKIFRHGVELQRRGAFRPAAQAYFSVLRADPSNVPAKNNLCLSLLASGNYEAGFKLYDIRFERQVGRVAKPKLSFPEWQGERLLGRSILIWPEQGFGDQIMFSRFAALLAAGGGAVSMLVERALVRLFEHLPVTVIAAEDDVLIPRHDFWVMAGSIPGRLSRRIPTEPYLPSESTRRGVGLMATARPFPPGRSLDEACTRAILELPGVRSLDPTDTGAADFEDSRRLIAELEIVISVDTAVAHLAGAMGKPCFVMLPHVADWRWGDLAERSELYPSARLFRQHEPGDWSGPLAAITKALSG